MHLPLRHNHCIKHFSPTSDPYLPLRAWHALASFFLSVSLTDGGVRKRGRFLEQTSYTTAFSHHLWLVKLINILQFIMFCWRRQKEEILVLYSAQALSKLFHVASVDEKGGGGNDCARWNCTTRQNPPIWNSPCYTAIPFKSIIQFYSVLTLYVLRLCKML